jgi:hypothetical protein
MQSRNSNVAALLVRVWFLFHFGLMGFGLFLGAAIMLFRVANGAGYPFALSANLFWILVVFVLSVSLAHVLAFVAIAKRTTWSWILALIITVANLLLHGAMAAIRRQSDPASYAFVAILMFQVLLLLFPGIRTQFGPRAISA